MRARKNPIPLTLDNMLLLTPGRAYTINALTLIFCATPAQILECMAAGLAAGQIHESAEVHGFRKTFWVPIKPPENVATRRIAPMSISGELKGYDAWLRRQSPRLCLDSR